MTEQLLPIGQFSARCRLSIKALRLYDRLGLVVPVRIDPATGYGPTSRRGLAHGRAGRPGG